MKKKPLPSGLPISFLDALGLALAAMLLLMFTNLSALQSKKPPPERYHLIAKICFYEVDIARTLWKFRWKYRSQSILNTHLQSDLSKEVAFGKEARFPEHQLFKKPFRKKIRSGSSLLHLYGMASIRDEENQSTLCYSLDLAFPVDEEPSLDFEIERAKAIPAKYLKQLVSDHQNPSCWRKAVILEEKSEVGELLTRVYPMPYQINVTAYTTGAKSEFAASNTTWVVPQQGSDCQLKKINFHIRLADEKLILKQTEVKR